MSDEDDDEVMEVQPPVVVLIDLGKSGQKRISIDREDIKSNWDWDKMLKKVNEMSGLTKKNGLVLSLSNAPLPKIDLQTWLASFDAGPEHILCARLNGQNSTFDLTKAVDVSPDANFIKSQIVDVTFVGAICELIENALEATMQATNDPEDRLVHVDVDQANAILTISDNGKGMTPAEMAKLSKIGATSHLSAAGPPGLLSGRVGRYGIGRYACFKFGDNVVVTIRSRYKGSSQVSEFKWEYNSMRRKNDMRPSALIVKDIAASDTSIRPHFTEVIISNCCNAFMDEWRGEGVRVVRRMLAEKYFFYLYGMKILPGQPFGTATRVFHLVVDGTNLNTLSAADNDLLNICETVEEEKLADFNFKLDRTTVTMTGPDGQTCDATMCMILYYFPTRRGLETMPVPRAIRERSSQAEQDSIPIVDRKPGALVLWQELYLLAEDPKILKFLDVGNRSELAHYRNRVKGFLFLDESFAIHSHKTLLTADDKMLKALHAGEFGRNERKSKSTLKKAFQEKLASWHLTLDDEGEPAGDAIVEIIRIDGVETRVNKYLEFHKNSIKYSKNDVILLTLGKQRNSIIGTVQYFAVPVDKKNVEMHANFLVCVDEKRFNQPTFYPVTAIERKPSSQKDATTKLTMSLNSLPHAIRSLGASHPTTVNPSTALPLSFQIVDANNTPVSSQDFIIKMAGTFAEAGKSPVDVPGLSVALGKRVNNTFECYPKLKHEGNYELTFTVVGANEFGQKVREEYLKRAKLTLQYRVEAEDPTSFQISWLSGDIDQPRLPLGEEIPPIILCGFDESGKLLRIPAHYNDVKLTLSGFPPGCKNKSALQFSPVAPNNVVPYSKDSVVGLVAKGVVFQGAKLDEALQRKNGLVDLNVEWRTGAKNSVTKVSMKIHIVAGQIYRASLSTNTLLTTPVRRGPLIEPIQLRLEDEWGNVYTEEDMIHIAPRIKISGEGVSVKPACQLPVNGSVNSLLDINGDYGQRGQFTLQLLGSGSSARSAITASSAFTIVKRALRFTVPVTNDVEVTSTSSETCVRASKGATLENVQLEIFDPDTNKIDEEFDDTIQLVAADNHISVNVQRGLGTMSRHVIVKSERYQVNHQGLNAALNLVMVAGKAARLVTSQSSTGKANTILRAGVRAASNTINFSVCDEAGAKLSCDTILKEHPDCYLQLACKDKNYHISLSGDDGNFDPGLMMPLNRLTTLSDGETFVLGDWIFGGASPEGILSGHQDLELKLLGSKLPDLSTVIRFKVECGNIARLQCSPSDVSLEHRFELADPFMVRVVDKYGNTVFKCNEKLTLLLEPGNGAFQLKLPTATKLQNGELRLPFIAVQQKSDMHLKTPVDLKLRVTFTSESTHALVSTYANLYVSPSKKAVQMILDHPKTSTLNLVGSGSKLPDLRIAVLNEIGQSIPVTSDALQMTLIATRGKLVQHVTFTMSATSSSTSDSMEVDSDDTPVQPPSMPNLFTLRPTTPPSLAIGEYRLKLIYTESTQIPIELSIPVNRESGTAAKLTPQAGIWNEVIVLGNRQFDLTVAAVDDSDNATSDVPHLYAIVNGGQRVPGLVLSINDVDCSQGVTSLPPNLFKNGVSSLRVHVTDGIDGVYAASGSYSLAISLKDQVDSTGSSTLQIPIKFTSTSSTTLQDKQQAKLLEEVSSLQQQLDVLKSRVVAADVTSKSLSDQKLKCEHDLKQVNDALKSLQRLHQLETELKTTEDTIRAAAQIEASSGPSYTCSDQTVAHDIERLRQRLNREPIPGFLGFVCDLGKVTDDRMNAVFSKALGNKMLGIVFETQRELSESRVKDDYPSLIVLAMDKVSHRAAPKQQINTDTPQRPILPNRSLSLPLGADLLINHITLDQRQLDQDLRARLWYSLLPSYVVFDTNESMQAYLARPSTRVTCPMIAKDTLDTVSADGWQGGRRSESQRSFGRFGVTAGVEKPEVAKARQMKETLTSKIKQVKAYLTDKERLETNHRILLEKIEAATEEHRKADQSLKSSEISTKLKEKKRLLSEQQGVGNGEIEANGSSPHKRARH